MLALVFPGCTKSGEEKPAEQQKPMLRDINDVMRDHTNELMSLPGVVGVFIGQGADGVPCIKVMIAEEDSMVIRRIPKELEGHTVIVEVTGEIRPL